MTNRSGAVTLLPQLALATLFAPAMAASAEPLPAPLPPPYEVSSNGLETVFLNAPEPPRAESQAAEGTPSVFGDTPDWSNDLRRQVGGIRMADMDRDGDLDAVIVCYNSQSSPPYDDWHNLIYFNEDGVLEASPSWISTDEVSTGDLTVADFNDDQHLDIFVANGGFAMAKSRIYFGGPSGPSTSPSWAESTTTWTNFALAVDVNDDGFPDVVTANQGNSQNDPFRPMHLYMNDAGTLDTVPSWSSDETSIQNFLSAGDLDGNGWPDIAVSKWINFETAVYRNFGGVLETVPGWTTMDDGDDKGIGWADVDGNGTPDLAVGHDPTRMYRNTAGVLTLDWSASGTFFGHSDLLWEDVDRDGDPDLAEVHFANGVVNVYLNQGGTLDSVPAWSFDSSAVGTALAFGDVNGDTMPDLIVGNAGLPSVMVFYNRLSAPNLFADGFESGDTSAWSVTVP